jgi:hypothetical protein
MNYGGIGESMNSDKRLNVSPTDIFSSLITGLTWGRAYPTLTQMGKSAVILRVSSTSSL